MLSQSPIPCSWSGSASDKSGNGLWTEGTSLPGSGCEKPPHNCLSLPLWWEWRLCFKIVMKQGGRSLSLPTDKSKAGLSLVKIFDQAKISLKASPIGSLISALLRLKLRSHILSFYPSYHIGSVLFPKSLSQIVFLSAPVPTTLVHELVNNYLDYLNNL